MMQADMFIGTIWISEGPGFEGLPKNESGWSDLIKTRWWLMHVPPPQESQQSKFEFKMSFLNKPILKTFWAGLC